MQAALWRQWFGRRCMFGEALGMDSVALGAVGEVCGLKDDGGLAGAAVTRNQGDVGGAVAVVVVESGFKDWRASGRSLPVDGEC
jgi:hypothetical protein